MPLFDNKNRILQIETQKEEIFKLMENPLISQPFVEDLLRDFPGVQMQSRGIHCRWKKQLQ